MLKTLVPPKDPQEAIISRRNPCYGFGIIASIEEHTALISLLTETRESILQIIHPDRPLKPVKSDPIHSPFYIKQSFFHATVFGMTPLLDKQDFVTIYANEKGLLSHEAMDKMCNVLQDHLKEKKPFLEPIQCELINKDGTILARFKYKTESNAETPLLNLTEQLDPEKKFSNWDSSNPLRYTTVTIAICVVDIAKMSEKVDALQNQLKLASEKLQKLGNIDITQFHFINSYDKRTLSLKHILMYASIEPNNIYKI